MLEIFFGNHHFYRVATSSQKKETKFYENIFLVYFAEHIQCDSCTQMAAQTAAICIYESISFNATIFFRRFSQTMLVAAATEAP